jgi:hypothetical protein
MEDTQIHAHFWERSSLGGETEGGAPCKKGHAVICSPSLQN